MSELVEPPLTKPMAEWDADYLNESRKYEEQELRQRAANMERLKTPEMLAVEKKATELALRSLPEKSKIALRQAGYTGDLSPLPPGPDSGVLYARADAAWHNTGGKLGTVRYEGDSRVWQKTFMPPQKSMVMAWRHNMTDAAWNARVDQAKAHLRQQGGVGQFTFSGTEGSGLFTLEQAKKILDGR
jgi:hypothetical protein